MITINGEAKEGYEEMTVEEMLFKEGIHRERIAVEKNGEIIPKSVFGQELLRSDDVIEVVSFVGGG